MEKEKLPISLRILRRYCPASLLEEIEGDLLQKYWRDIKAFGKRRADRRIFWNVCRYFRPGIIFRRKLQSLKSIDMLLNYFKVALRVMMRSKVYSAINIFGLTLGIAGSMLLFLWVAREFSFDQFHANKQQLYVVYNREPSSKGVDCWDYTPRVLAPTFKAEIPAMESAVSYAYYQVPFLFTVGQTKIVRNTGVFVEPEFLSMFSFPLVQGNLQKAFDDPSSIVLTEKFARELFGYKEPLGEVITLSAEGNDIPFKVTGILKDLPANTDFHFDYLISWKFVEKNYGVENYWFNNSVVTYVKLREGQDSQSVSNLIRDFKRKHTDQKIATEYFLYPFSQHHLYSKFVNGIPNGGRIEIVRMLGLLGICLVIVACINFINLTTARAQKRAREVGVRKVNGAFRFSLVTQFLCESVVTASVAGALSLIVVYIALPFFNVLINQQLALEFKDLSFWVTISSFMVFVGVLAGGYPAFYLSALSPIKVLKGKIISVSNRNKMRQTLVIVQFGFAVVMIFSVIVISRQIRFVQQRQAGYAKENLIYQAMTGELGKNFASYKNELLASGAVVSVTRTSSPMTERWSDTGDIQWRGKGPEDETTIERFVIDENISATAGLQIVKGRDLDLKTFPSDSTSVLLNETAAKLMGFADPIGEVIEDNHIKWQVVGVVKDFVLTSPYQKVQPIILEGCKKSEMLNDIHARLNPSFPMKDAIQLISELNKKYNPAYPLEFHFIDEEYARKFADLETTFTITTVFGFIAISIACLGLLGLSTFMIESREKEIGIRKVLGGTSLSIVQLLTSSSLRPIFISVIFFSPLAWLAMKWWLQHYDYRVEISFWIIPVTALTVLALAFFTTALQTVQAANQNPVRSIKYE
jgi:ABC-type antimicrobial peptide transport system permease subunit